MFTLTIEKGLQIALVEPKFAPLYLEIVSRDREYLSQWLAWPPHADSDDFFLSFIKSSSHDYAEGKSQGKITNVFSSKDECHSYGNGINNPRPGALQVKAV